jgi:predicted nucleic-acid-binding Zn-ribbon protein
MIQPTPFKLKCKNCGYSKIVSPKSDALDPSYLMQNCSKCNKIMEKIPLTLTDKLISKIFTS